MNKEIIHQAAQATQKDLFNTTIKRSKNVLPTGHTVSVRLQEAQLQIG
jgi:uncharacterized lipoprotein YbaY